jgi:hypothetical protein
MKTPAATRARADENDHLVPRLVIEIAEGDGLVPQRDVQGGGAARLERRALVGAVQQGDRLLGDAADRAVADLGEGRAADRGAGPDRQGQRDRPESGDEAAC